MGGCWFFLFPDRCENTSFDSPGHFSINDFWWQWCFKEPLSHPCPYALWLWPVSMNFSGWWTLSNSRCEWKNTPFFLSCSSDRSGPCFSVQRSPARLRAGIAAERRRLARSRRHSRGGGNGAAKAPLGSAALPGNATPWLWRYDTTRNYTLWSSCHRVHGI